MFHSLLHWHLWDAILPNEEKFVIWREESEESRTAVLKTVLIDPQRKVERTASVTTRKVSPECGGECLAGTGEKGAGGERNTIKSPGSSKVRRKSILLLRVLSP